MKELAGFSIITDEVRIKNNMLPPGEYNMNPRFSRATGVTEDNKYLLELGVEIADSEEMRFPIDLFIKITGVFDLEKIPEDKREEFLKIQGVHIVMPHLRSMVASLTAGSMMPPIVLPIFDAKRMFPEDSAV